MKSGGKFQLGIETLLADGRKLLQGKRVGLLAHPASVDTRGCHSSVLLREVCGEKLVALFGPEHGFYGSGGAGEKIGDAKHPAWGIPIHSLYGEHRRPTEEMLRDLDVLVFDLQDIGVRCYTFVSTLRYVMEECARLGKTLIVCDRPIPMPDTTDGPEFDPQFESFVACVPTTMVYGMTPAESARFLKAQLELDLDLRVMPMAGYKRQSRRGATWGPWISPSPGIRYWETAWYYPATVFFEAMPAIDYGRGGLEPFQVVSSPFIDAEEFADLLNNSQIPGVRFSPYWNRHPGVRLHCTNIVTYRPVFTAYNLILGLQQLYGKERLWNHPGTRPDFFDKLAGDDALRRVIQGGRGALLDSDPPGTSATFVYGRREALLYS